MNVVKNDLFDYENRYIYQVENMFKFSLDSILLSEYVKIKNDKEIVVDLCTGLAPLPLILSTKHINSIHAFEIQKIIANIAKKSVSYNNLDQQIKIYNDDIKNIFSYFPKKSIDIVTCNPPFFKVNEDSIVNKDENIKFSRHEYLINLEDIISISSSLLKDNGRLFMVHRPERIDEIIILANKYNLNVKELVNIITNDKNNVSTILIKCVKNSKNNMLIKVKNTCNLTTYKNLFKE